MNILTKFMISSYRANELIYDKGMASLWSIVLLEPLLVFFFWFLLNEEVVTRISYGIINYYTIFGIGIFIIFFIDDNSALASQVKTLVSDPSIESWDPVVVVFFYMVFFLLLSIISFTLM